MLWSEIRGNVSQLLLMSIIKHMQQPFAYYFKIGHFEIPCEIGITCTASIEHLPTILCDSVVT